MKRKMDNANANMKPQMKQLKREMTELHTQREELQL